ncbi:response regulator transcription factor [Paludibacter sp.]
MKILVVEDDVDLQKIIKESLEKEQYLVETVDDYYTASAKVSVYEYDCILLDILLPGGNGLKLLHELKRERKTSNVIIISAKDSLEDRVLGLELGADDYLPKPFHLAELTARIKAVIRRNTLAGSTSIEFANIELNPDERTLFVTGILVTLNRKEFDLFTYLLFNKNRLVSKIAIAEHVWGDKIDQADNFDFIYYQIKNLRKKLSDAGAEINIEAVYGIGYKLSEV